MAGLVQFDAPPELLRRWAELKARKSELDRAAQARYLHDPAGWARDRLGVHLWSKQEEIAASVVANRRTAVRSAHGVGKSFTAAVLALWWIDVHPPGTAMVVSTAPSHEQVHAVLWEEIRRLHARGDLPGEVQRSDRWLDEQGRLVGLGRRPPDHAESAFQGIHRQFVLCLLDEAGGIPAWLWTAGEAITTGEDCRMVAIGNPDDNSSEFARVCLRDPGWHTIRISAFDSPNLSGEPVPDAIAKVLISQAWVEDKRQRWGETNPLFLAKVLGEFADSEDGLVPLSWVTAAQGRWRVWDEAGRPPQPGRLVLGVDVARYGEDKTCIAHRYGDVVAQLDRHAKLDTTQTTSLVAAALHRQPKAVAVVDVIGVGAGVVDQCRALGLPVRAFNASATTRMRDSTGSWKFRNMRSWAWWNVRELLDPALNSTLALPTDDELAAELTVPTWAPAAGSVLNVEAKDSVRKRLGRSTDSADAVCMALAQEKTWQTDEEGRALRPKVRRYADSVSWG